MNDIKNQIDIVLVETSHPGNIGSVARAMRTMGLKNLILVTSSYGLKLYSLEGLRTTFQ